MKPHLLHYSKNNYQLDFSLLCLVAVLAGTLIMAGCGTSSTDLVNTNTTTPTVDGAIQGLWAGTGTTNIGPNTIVEITFTHGTISMIIDEPNEVETISADYQVKEIQGSQYILSLSHFDIDSSSNTDYETILATVIVKLTASDQIEFYPETQPEDLIVLYRQ